MLYTSSPINQNISNNVENIPNTINRSEINQNNNPLLEKCKIMNVNETNSIQVINPFDSIASKKYQIQLQSFSNNSNRVNNRYSQVSNSISVSNSQINKDTINNDYNSRYKQFNNISYSLSSNRINGDTNTINTQLNHNTRSEKSINNNSSDIKFEIINNEEASNYKNSNNAFSSSLTNSNISVVNNNNGIKKKENFNIIKESDEEEYNEDEKQLFSRAINLNDLESYVTKYKPIFKDKKNNYEINKRVSDIINNSPFDNVNISINNNGEVNIDNLLTVSNIVKIKSLNNQQITEQFNKDFYEQILSAKKFSNLNAVLHGEGNFNSELISVSQLHTYNGKNNNLINKKIRDIYSSDGNGFLKAFIFNYFENLIANLCLENIIFIIYIISTKLSLLNVNDVNIQEVLTILKIIFTHLEKNNINEAYIVLINAFQENSNFEKGLVYFVKYCLKQFITDNYILFNIDYLNEIISSSKYINNLNNQFDYQNYIQEKIMRAKDEIHYEVLIYFLLPLIFPINLIIYTNSITKMNKIIFKNNSSNNKNNIFDIELNVKFGNISIIYNDKYFNKFKDVIPYTNEFNFPVDKIKKIPNKKEDQSQTQNIKCNVCNNNPDNFIQVGPKIKPLCEKCFINSINKVINKRYTLLKDDLFFHEEFYCSKIKLTNALENNLYLSLNDVKILLPNHNDLSYEIRILIIKNKKCDLCSQNFKHSKYSICLYPCGDIICDKCFIKYINNATHKRVILNNFEIKTENFEYICPNPSCKISKIQNIDRYIFLYFSGVEEFSRKAEERLEIQAKKICCICKKVNNKYFFDVEINKNKGKRNLKHAICKDGKKKLDNSSKIRHQTKFMCEFCEEYHIYNSLNLQINKDREKNESCCFIF